jgi:hypothetical protein
VDSPGPREWTRLGGPASVPSSLATETGRAFSGGTCSAGHRVSQPDTESKVACRTSLWHPTTQVWHYSMPEPESLYLSRFIVCNMRGRRKSEKRWPDVQTENRGTNRWIKFFRRLTIHTGEDHVKRRTFFSGVEEGEQQQAKPAGTFRPRSQDAQRGSGRCYFSLCLTFPGGTVPRSLTHFRKILVPKWGRSYTYRARRRNQG